VTPRLNLRYTRYGASLADEGSEERPVIHRRFLESSVQMQGPQFSRVFNNPGGLYSERFKHIIGPEASWSYRTRVEDFSQIPRFDRIDYFLGTHEIRYGLVNRFLAKRPGRGDKLVTHEFLSWRLYQTYYVQIDDNQNSYDPNYSSSAFGPGGEASHYSPIRSQVRLSPSRQLRFDYNLEYDVNFRQLRNMSVRANLNYRRVQLGATWSRAKRISELPEERVWRRDTLRANGSLDLLPGRLRVEGGADLDLRPAELLGDRSRLIQAMGRLRYDVQCCGFMVEAINYSYNQRSERQIRFSIELANIGSVGNFMGQEGQQAGRGRSW
jgi:hypothetical protein